MKKPWYTYGLHCIVSFCCAVIACSALAVTLSTEGIQVYKKNEVLSSEKKQTISDDLNRYRNADNMWDVLRQEFSLPHYEENPQVQEQIEWYMNHRAFLYESASRAAPYLYYIMQQVRKRHLPAELALLPVFESAYNPFAYSSAGAAGIWQMMSATASGLGIKQNWWYDGRRDVIASTKAALNYLAYLGDFFSGNWLLAIAAYDTGAGNVLSAIKKNIRNGISTDYWSLPLARETKDYLPKLLALAVVISNPQKYPVELPYVRNAPYLAQVDVGKQLDLKHAAILAGISSKKLTHLNPGYNRLTMDPNGPYKLVLPIENIAQFMENLERSPSYHGIRFIHYKIKRGDTLPILAKRFNTSPTEIRQINPTLASNLKPGVGIVIPRSSQSITKTPIEAPAPIIAAKPTPSSEQIIAEATKQDAATAEITKQLIETEQHKYTLQSGDTVYMVRKGDTLKRIAKRFHLAINLLEQVNQISQHDALIPGKKLTIPTHYARTNAIKQYKISPGDTVYMVRKGDDIEKIAKKFHTTAAAIRLSNLIAGQLNEGDRLVIPTHLG